MDETTYKDPATIALLQSKYILVRVDQDARPDLSNRYEDYGWPATIVFAANGQEIVKRQGYIPPREMASMLRAIIADPSPGPSVTPETKIEFPASPFLPADLRKRLQESYLTRYDTKHGSWGFDQKFLDWDGVEYAIATGATRMARQTLDAQLNLIDPVWGGVYQYSTGGDWKEPHFEKIMQMQAENLRIYALAYEKWAKPEYLKAALDIHRFLKNFLLSPEGAFYTSQDADVVAGQHSARYFKLNDAGRRRMGVPRVDKHMYARENGWAIHAVTALHQATGDAALLTEATRAANWVMQNRQIAGGGFRHDALDEGGPYLGDTLAMSRAFLNLYAATGDRAWLKRSAEGLRFIAGDFKNAKGAGFVTSRNSPRPQRDENVTLARLANLLFEYTGDKAFRQAAEEALRYAAAPQVAESHSAAPVLLAELEMGRTPIHLTIVGHKDDPEARQLFAAALRQPSGYRRIEWWDRREGPLPRADVEYPELKHAAAFICTERSCSSPILNPEQLLARLSK